MISDLLANKGRPKTLFVGQTFTKQSGQNARILRMTKAWHQYGYNSAYVSLLEDSDNLLSGDEFDFTVRFLPATNREALSTQRVDTLLQLGHTIETLKPRLVVANEYYADYFTKLALLGKSTPIVTFSGDTTRSWSRTRRFILQLLSEKSSAYLGNFKQALESYRRNIKLGPFPTSANGILHNSVDPEEYETKFERSTDEDLIVGGLGVFRKRKGFKSLIKGFAKLPETINGKTTRLFLKGTGKREKNLRALKLKHNLSDRCKFETFSPEVEDFYHSVDCLVVPTLTPRFDNVLLESINAGTLTLGTPESGLRLIPELSDYSVESGSAESISERLHHFLQFSSNERAALARNQREHVIDKFGLSKIAQQFESFLIENEILGE